MKIHFLLVLTLLVAMPLVCLFAQDDTEYSLDDIHFLLGKWKTKSEFVRDGSVANGTLEFKEILGGAWIRVTFIGDHPSGRPWEAHGFVGMNDEGEGFTSYIVFGPDKPVVYSGIIVNNKTFRLETTFNGMTSGIDYIPQEDGTIYQENWVLDEQGSRRITLKTWYTAISD